MTVLHLFKDDQLHSVHDTISSMGKAMPLDQRQGAYLYSTISRHWYMPNAQGGWEFVPAILVPMQYRAWLLLLT